MVDIPFYWLDIFTSEPFKGNPAAVCVMKTDLEDSLYLSIAKELGLTETAFTEKIGEGEYKLRWFTSRREVPMCGYATIATAYTLRARASHFKPIIFPRPLRRHPSFFHNPRNLTSQILKGTKHVR